MEVLRKNKTELIDILMTDRSILQYIQQEKLVTDREYTILKSIPQPYECTYEMIDKLMQKGNDTSKRFLKLLQQAKIRETYPRLEDLLQSTQPGPSTTARKGPKIKIEPRKKPEKMSSWCGYLHEVSGLIDGAKSKYLKAVLETEKENMDVLIFNLEEKKRFEGAAKRLSKVQLRDVSYEPLGVSQGKNGLKFTQNSKLSFKKILPFNSKYHGKK